MFSSQFINIKWIRVSMESGSDWQNGWINTSEIVSISDTKKEYNTPRHSLVLFKNGIHIKVMTTADKIMKLITDAEDSDATNNASQ